MKITISAGADTCTATFDGTAGRRLVLPAMRAPGEVGAVVIDVPQLHSVRHTTAPVPAEDRWSATSALRDAVRGAEEVRHRIVQGIRTAVLAGVPYNEIAAAVCPHPGEVAPCEERRRAALAIADVVIDQVVAEVLAGHAHAGRFTYQQQITAATSSLLIRPVADLGGAELVEACERLMRDLAAREIFAHPLPGPDPTGGVRPPQVYAPGLEVGWMPRGAYAITSQCRQPLAAHAVSVAS